MDTELLILEAARLALQSYFMQLRLSGKSDEEIDDIYKLEKEKFQEYDPDKLPDV